MERLTLIPHIAPENSMDPMTLLFSTNNPYQSIGIQQAISLNHSRILRDPENAARGGI